MNNELTIVEKHIIACVGIFFGILFVVYSITHKTSNEVTAIEDDVVECSFFELDGSLYGFPPMATTTIACENFKRKLAIEEYKSQERKRREREEFEAYCNSFGDRPVSALPVKCYDHFNITDNK